ncbi:hypothetical protein COJ46_21540 [Bacillus sp. AFS077874]|uniref:hypothetical protein n=1 Tax=unclassified Bacillus (in: firmicutes) TaxID=185979 RepID=UPI000BEB395A|nr:MULTISPECIES: hypothetical protein [unclassified Bacillus (in: firmicutes)]PEC49178.1 hypothetical protein CON00_13085 [Bacillus sp. AFS096315]PFM75402.1 hypothetical protein COJ46_21540 [Bacillus sp. AFS077874]
MKIKFKNLLMIAASSYLLLSGCKEVIVKNHDSKDNENLKYTSANILKSTLNSISDSIQDQVNKLTLKEKIGQMIIAGFDGISASYNQFGSLFNL